jgi:hypothetical protein
VKVGPLQYGLQPVAFSASGSRLLAEYEEQDVPEAWSVSVPETGLGNAYRIMVKDQQITLGYGLSADGRSVLIGSIYTANVATVPAGGGQPNVIVKHGFEASWNK